MSLSDKYFKIIKEISDKYCIAAFGDSTFNDACFIIEHGAEKDKNGKIEQRFRKLPHHSKNATDPNANNTVDIPHLRNALARVNQIKTIKEDRTSFIKRATAHLQKHAKSLLKTYKKSSAEYTELETMCKEFDIKGD